MSKPMTTIKFAPGCVDDVPIRILAGAFADLGLELVARPDGTLLARKNCGRPGEVDAEVPARDAAGGWGEK